MSGNGNRSCRKHRTVPRGQYYEYIRSEQWGEKKQEFREKSKRAGCCCVCRTKFSLQTHHLTYKRLGDESLGDLRHACGDCHSTISAVATAYFRGNQYYATKFVIKHVKRLMKKRRWRRHKAASWLNSHLYYLAKFKPNSPKWNRLPGEGYFQAKKRLQAEGRI